MPWCSEKASFSKWVCDNIIFNINECELLKHATLEGRLDGSVSWPSDLGSGHDLMVCGFEPCVRFCADSSEPGTCFRVYVSLSPCPSPNHTLSLCLKNKQILKNFFQHATLNKAMVKRWMPSRDGVQNLFPDYLKQTYGATGLVECHCGGEERR